jgi:hypothetical protein
MAPAKKASDTKRWSKKVQGKIVAQQFVVATHRKLMYVLVGMFSLCGL